MRRMLGALAAIMLAHPVGATVKSVAPQGFEVEEAMEIAAPPKRVFEALSELPRWWSSKHSMSGDANNLYLETRAGGCFCERLKDGGEVQWMTVVFASPASLLRLRGGLGPLQAEGVEGAMTFTLKAAEAGHTNIEVSYIVGGYLRGGPDKWAQPVDQVLAEQVGRLKLYIETGSPEGAKTP